MERIFRRIVLARWQNILLGFLLSVVSVTSFAVDNQLTKQERLAGWQLLFNGKDLSHWRNFKQESINDKWTVDQGAMQLSAGGGGEKKTTAEATPLRKRAAGLQKVGQIGGEECCLYARAA